MSKEEAIEALVIGKILTHELFVDNESVRQPRADISEYELEDGVRISKSLFWYFRKQNYWNDGWIEKTN